MRLKKVSDGYEYTFIHKFGMIEGFRNKHYAMCYKIGDKSIGYDIFYGDKTFNI